MFAADSAAARQAASVESGRKLNRGTDEVVVNDAEDDATVTDDKDDASGIEFDDDAAATEDNDDASAVEIGDDAAGNEEEDAAEADGTASSDEEEEEVNASAWATRRCLRLELAIYPKGVATLFERPWLIKSVQSTPASEAAVAPPRRPECSPKRDES